MLELYVLKRIDTDQYYYAITPFGSMIWTDIKEEGQYLTETQAENLIDRFNGIGNPKYYELELELT